MSNEEPQGRYAPEFKLNEKAMEALRRAEVCVRACEGLSTSDLEKGLLAELIHALREIDDSNGTSLKGMAEGLKKLRALREKVKGVK